MIKKNISNYLIQSDSSIREAINCIDKNVTGIALVVDSNQKLLATITDGDVRRAMLLRHALDTPVSVILETKKDSIYPEPVVASLEDSSDDLLKLMKERVVRQVPILDQEGRVVNLVILDELISPRDGDAFPLHAVVLAGGQSTRLHPLVEDLAKPMLPVGNRTLFEYTINQLIQAGINQISLTTSYKSEEIVQYFGDGEDFGVRLNYLNKGRGEDVMQTLTKLSNSDEPVLVVNGDVLTQLDFRAMLGYHLRNKADLTIAVRKHDFIIPFGVIETENEKINGFIDKPIIQRFINAGIYIFSPAALKRLPSDWKFDAEDAINLLMKEECQIISFPIHEYWRDIQLYEDYQKAIVDAESGVFKNFSSTVQQLEPGAPVPRGVIPLCVPEISGNEWIYIKECIDTNWVSSVGAFVTRFEEIVADFVGAQYGVATNNGTAALHISLLVAGVQPDDEVLVSNLSFVAPANAIRYAGAWPVFIDAEPDFWQIDPQKIVNFLEDGCEWRHGELHNKISGRRVKAILPVHILGHPCQMDIILDIASKYNLIVIEDATESLGATYRGEMVGHLGNIACFSFNGNKLITTGGGG